MTKKTVCITLDEDLVKDIDSFRQLIPRSAFVEFVLNDYMTKWMTE